MFDNKNVKIQKLIHGFLKRRGALQDNVPNDLPAWPAVYYGLDKSQLFQQLDDVAQFQILKTCAQDLLNESYFIEKMGLEYCAKLTLLSPCSQSKQIFSLIGADEATHLQWITPFVPESMRHTPTSPLLSLIRDVVTLNNENLLYYLVQIILEGWGLEHYKQLSQYCLNPTIQKIFADILQDEALHHQSGKTLFDSKKLSKQDKFIVQDHLKAYCDLIRIGPQSVVNAVSLELGGLNEKQRAILFDELQTEQQSKAKLNYIFSLMMQPGLEALLQNIHDLGYFSPYPAITCAKLVVQ